MQQYTTKSTGFAVQTEDGQRWLLTNAHSVSYNTQAGGGRRAWEERGAVVLGERQAAAGHRNAAHLTSLPHSTQHLPAAGAAEEARR